MKMPKQRLQTLGAVDCLEAGGALDAQAEAEATERALHSLLSLGVVEDMSGEDASNFTFFTTR